MFCLNRLGKPEGPHTEKQLHEGRRSRLRCFVALVLLAVLLCVGAGGWAAYSHFVKASRPRIAALLPEHTQLYLEVPNLRAAALGIRRSRYLKTNGSSDKTWLEEQAAIVAESFGIDKKAALALTLAQHSLGFGAAPFADHPGLGILLQFEASSPVRNLLESGRFREEGALGQSGRRYRLSAKRGASPKRNGWAQSAQQALDNAHTSAELSLGYWKKPCLLALGAPEVLAEIAAVQDGTGRALADLQRFKQAMDTRPSNAVLLGWLDGKATQNALEGHNDLSIELRDEGALLSASTEDAGLLLELAATLVGDDVTNTPLLFDATELQYPSQLPEETVAYVAASTKTSLDGERMAQELRGVLRRKEPRSAAEFDEGMRQFEEIVGVSVADALGCVGDELVMGITAADGYRLTKRAPEALEKLGAFLALRLKEPAIAETLVAYVRDEILAKELGDALTVEGKGFRVATPLGPNVVVEVRFLERQLILAGGSAPMVSKAMEAFSAKGARLGEDEAHSAVVSTLPKQVVGLAWLDTGRVTGLLLKGDPEIHRMAYQSGVSLDQFETSGPRRITSAATTTILRHQKAWQVQFNSVNLVHGVGLVGAASAFGATDSLQRLFSARSFGTDRGQ